MQQTIADGRYYEQERSEIARLITGQPKSILEIGCANGCFRRNLKWECEYHGVEPVHEVADRARASGIIVYEGVYQDVAGQIPDAKFDLVVCNDVIEHMVDPWAFLENIKRKLAPGGRIVGSLPNVRYITNLLGLVFGKEWRYANAGVLDRTHLRFFTLKSARRLFEECGYEVEVLRPSGPDRYRNIKRLLAPFFLPFGTDMLYMQMAFVIAPR